MDPEIPTLHRHRISILPLTLTLTLTPSPPRPCCPPSQLPTRIVERVFVDPTVIHSVVGPPSARLGMGEGRSSLAIPTPADEIAALDQVRAPVRDVPAAPPRAVMRVGKPPRARVGKVSGRCLTGGAEARLAGVGERVPPVRGRARIFWISAVGDVALVAYLAARPGGVRRGEIVVFPLPGGCREAVVVRLFAEPDTNDGGAATEDVSVAAVAEFGDDIVVLLVVDVVALGRREEQSSPDIVDEADQVVGALK